MTKHNKIFENDRQYREFIARSSDEVVAVVRKFKENWTRKYLPTDWKAIVNPWGEIKRLRAHVEGMREADWTATRNVLDLYAENELLRRYKSLADGEMHNFVAADDHKALQKEHKRTKEKLARVSQSLNDFQTEWEETIKAIPNRAK